MRRTTMGLMLASCLSASCLHAQEMFRIMEYNVENLFDCEHDSLKNDMEFLPESIRGWNSFRFRKKANSIAKVIFSACEGDVPDLVGLCEVENRNCLDMLTKYSILGEAGYKYIMTESPDERGIDVALMYQPFKFRPILVEHIRINKQDAERPTRDILHVRGKIVTGDFLDVFVCHMPSRTGGRKVSEPYRLFTAHRLKEKVNDLLSLHPDANIVIMGDFNDYPSNKAILEILGADKPPSSIANHSLYNLMSGKEPGTYRYKGEWGILDHLIVNGRLLDRENSIHTSYRQMRIVQHSFLLEEDEKYGGMKPFRTYNGMRYNGGYSDHLPIIVEFQVK